MLNLIKEWNQVYHCFFVSCLISTAVCADKPCGSHGDCYEVSETPGSYHCECHEGFYGPTCTFKVDVCAQENCSGNGYCQVVPDFFGNPFPLCTCYGFYGTIDPIQGQQCHTPIRYDHCSPEVYPCQNGGQCKLVDYPEAYTCTCPPSTFVLLCLVYLMNACKA